MRIKSGELTAADLVVLSLLAEEPMHGYKIVCELDQRDAKDWAPVSRPQVYYSIKKLAALNLIAVASDTDGSQGPEREKFKIKQSGFMAMNEALSSTKWAQQRPPAPFTTWMALSTHLSPEKTKELINARRAYLNVELDREKKTLSEFDKEQVAMSTAGKLMVLFCIKSFELELDWLTEVSKELPSARKRKRSIRSHGKVGDPSFPLTELVHSIDFTPFFPKIKNRISAADGKNIAEMYEKGLSLRDIALQFGCSKNRIRTGLSKFGLKPREKSPQATHLRSLKSGKQSARPYYGFCYFEGEIVKDPREFPTLQLIHRHWSQGKSIHQINLELNRVKILSRTGKEWSWAALQNIVARFKNKQVILSKGGKYEFR